MCRIVCPRKYILNHSFQGICSKLFNQQCLFKLISFLFIGLVLALRSHFHLAQTRVGSYYIKMAKKPIKLSAIEQYRMEKKKEGQRLADNLKKIQQMSRCKASAAVSKALCKQFKQRSKKTEKTKKSVFSEEDWQRFEEEYVAK